MSPLPTAPAAPADHDARLRTAYLDEVIQTIYPAGPGPASFLVLPHPRRPRLLVPAGAWRAGAAAVRHATEPQSRRSRLARRTVAAAVRAGAADLLLRGRIRVDPDGSLQQHLAELLDTPVIVSIQIGPARANRKPVLQLLSTAGETIGFAKLGTGPLTRRLVRAEADALTALAGHRLRQLTVPRVVHAGRWRDHELLVQSAMPVWQRRAELYQHRLALAMRELAYCAGVLEATLATSDYWHRLQERVLVATGQPEGATLATAAARLHDRAGAARLRFGAWHGDWSPWNMAALPHTLLVWDWERFATGVPVGFDAVHYDLQCRLRSTSDAAAAVHATLAAAGDLLAPFGVPPAARRVTAQLYLVDLAARYLADRQAEAGARLGVLGSWLLPALIRSLEEER
ncbi:MAG TPA: hypothetical protein VIL37_12640 [Natronosporangium sp.]